MSKYTEETLDKLLKKDLISIVVSQQTEMDAANSEIMDQIRKFNENLEKLKSELIVVKQVNSVLSGKLVSMERQCWTNAQYSSVWSWWVYLVVLATATWRKTF